MLLQLRLAKSSAPRCSRWRLLLPALALAATSAPVAVTATLVFPTTATTVLDGHTRQGGFGRSVAATSTHVVIGAQ